MRLMSLLAVIIVLLAVSTSPAAAPLRSAPAFEVAFGEKEDRKLIVRLSGVYQAKTETWSDTALTIVSRENTVTLDDLKKARVPQKVGEADTIEVRTKAGALFIITKSGINFRPQTSTVRMGLWGEQLLNKPPDSRWTILSASVPFLYIKALKDDIELRLLKHHPTGVEPVGGKHVTAWTEGTLNLYLAPGPAGKILVRSIILFGPMQIDTCNGMLGSGSGWVECDQRKANTISFASEGPRPRGFSPTPAARWLPAR